MRDPSQRRSPLAAPAALAFSLVSALVCSAGCAVYDPPPEATIAGAVDGLLTDAVAPLVLSFSEPVDPATLRVKVVRDVLDVEGNLADEGDPKGDLDLFFSHEPGHIDEGGTSELVSGNTSLVIHLTAALPIGPRLVVLLEPGLADTGGSATSARRHLYFGYSFDLTCDKPSMALPSGKLFLLVDVKKPIGTQVQLFADFVVDPETGSLSAQFTSADRNRAKDRCPFPCSDTEACRLVPEPACVTPSERAGAADEFPDFLPNATPPVGFTFSGVGCVVDQPDGSAAFAIAPVDVVVQQPPVTLRNARMTAAFTRDAAGVLRGTGSLSSDDVLLGTSASGRGEGSLLARSFTEAEAPPGIPPAPEQP